MNRAIKNIINRRNSGRWPVVKIHDEASCFNCGGDLSGNPHDSGFPSGHGKWRQKCAKCDMTTWYDLEISNAN